MAVVSEAPSCMMLVDVSSSLLLIRQFPQHIIMCTCELPSQLHLMRLWLIGNVENYLEGLRVLNIHDQPISN